MPCLCSLRFQTVEYDSVANILRARGKTSSENEHVQLGAYHALELEVQRPFTLEKVRAAPSL